MHFAPRWPRGEENSMENVTFKAMPDGPIVFVAEVGGFGPVPITSRRKGIYSGRLPIPQVLSAAMKMVEAFAESHEAELAPHYAAIAEASAA
jgi:hypothetical protein